MALQIRKLNFPISGKSLEAVVASNPCQCGNWAMNSLVIQSKNGVFHTAAWFSPNFVSPFDSLVHQKHLSRAAVSSEAPRFAALPFLIHVLLF